MAWTIDKRILDFATTDDGKLVMDWSDGTRRVFDTKPHLIGDFMGALAEPGYFRKAYLQGHGDTIAWPNDQDFAPEWLYEGSTVIEKSGPLPPRGESMTWNDQKLITNLQILDDGRLTTTWSDGTCRAFDTWARANNDEIEKLADAAYFAQAKVSPRRDAIEWPGGETFEAKTLYEQAALIES